MSSDDDDDDDEYDHEYQRSLRTTTGSARDKSKRVDEIALSNQAAIDLSYNDLDDSDMDTLATVLSVLFP